MSVGLSCNRSPTNEEPNTTYTISNCSVVQIFVPLPCRGDPEVDCIIKRMKITAFKSCSEKDMNEIPIDYANPCT